MGKTETGRTSIMVPFLPVVPAGRQRVIAGLYVLETHFDTITGSLGCRPPIIRPEHCESS